MSFKKMTPSHDIIAEVFGVYRPSGDDSGGGGPHGGSATPSPDSQKGNTGKNSKSGVSGWGIFGIVLAIVIVGGAGQFSSLDNLYFFL